MFSKRLKLARRKAGLSLRDLSATMDGLVTAQAIGKYERAESMPSSGVLIALAKALNVSLTYLLDAQELSLAGVEFRTKANTTGKDRAHVETEVLEWIERYLQVETILDLDSAMWHCPVQNPRKLKNVADAEKLANDVREAWKLGTDPIPNMTELLEEKGLKVLTIDLPQRVSGFTCLVQRSKGQMPLPVIVVNNVFSLERRRLTLAHELAHRVIDTDSLGNKDEEKAANLFAGAFLMPAEHLHREVGIRRKSFGWQEVIELKRLYRVSGAAMLMRLRQLDVISESTLIYAWQTVARGWRTQEPEPLEGPNEIGKHERAHRFERLCYRALAEDLISLSKASELLREPIEEVEQRLKGPEPGHADRRQ
jgi:Zn-dependent peptidase ImmA (M78 family)/transcriptional regulator with XRE-family HTH domain